MHKEHIWIESVKTVSMEKETGVFGKNQTLFETLK